MSEVAPAAVARDLVLFGSLAYAVVTDVRARRISNRLSYTAAGLGAAINLAGSGWLGLQGSVFGYLAGFGILLIPYLFGALGAGDVKLLAAVGALKGPQFALYTAVYTGIAGGIVAGLYLLWTRAVPAARRLAGGERARIGGRPGLGAIPYAPAIAAGAVATLLLGS